MENVYRVLIVAIGIVGNASTVLYGLNMKGGWLFIESMLFGACLAELISSFERIVAKKAVERFVQEICDEAEARVNI